MEDNFDASHILAKSLCCPGHYTVKGTDSQMLANPPPQNSCISVTNCCQETKWLQWGFLLLKFSNIDQWKNSSWMSQAFADTTLVPASCIICLKFDTEAHVNIIQEYMAHIQASGFTAVHQQSCLYRDKWWGTCKLESSNRIKMLRPDYVVASGMICYRHA